MKRFGPPRGRETLPAYLWKYRFQFIVSSIGGILYNTLIVLGPILMGRLLDAAGGGTARRRQRAMIPRPSPAITAFNQQSISYPSCRTRFGTSFRFGNTNPLRLRFGRLTP